MSNPEQPGAVPPSAPQYPVQPGQRYPGPQYGGPQYGGQPYPYAYAPEPRTNVLAIISLVAAFVMSVAAVITGHIALSQIKRTGENGRGMALAGLIIGYIGVAITAVFFVVWLTLFISLASHGMSTTGISS
jgi:hypothetical protein